MLAGHLPGIPQHAEATEAKSNRWVNCGADPFGAAVSYLRALLTGFLVSAATWSSLIPLEIDCIDTHKV